MQKNLDSFRKKFEEKRKKGEFVEEHRNWVVKVLTNRPFFVLHLFAYCSVNGFLIMIFLLSYRFTGLTYFWPFNTLFGWGFGMGFHALTYIMYNDKSEYLTYIRQQSPYIMAFTYHAFFYISVNLFLFLLNLIDLNFVWFTWSLGMWGIAFGYHAIGFFTWNKIFYSQWKRLRPKFQDYSKYKLKHKIIVKIGNFWLLLIHMTYYIVAFIIVNIYVFVGTGLGQVEQFLILEAFVRWGIFLVLHAFGYILFYHIEFLSTVVKGLILHISIYIAFSGQWIYENIIYENYWSLLILIYIMILWAIGIVIHALITIRWNKLIEKERVRVRRKYDPEKTKVLEKFWTEFSGMKWTKEEPSQEEATQELTLMVEDNVRGSAKNRIFWKWSLIVHLMNYLAVIIILAINVNIIGLDPYIILHTAFGWGIGIAFHSSIYFVVIKTIRGFWATTAFIHSVVFITVNVYLIVINLIYTPNILWFPYALIGWGIGLGTHILIARAVNREKEKEREIKKTKVILFLQWSLMIHLFIYLMVLAIISITIISNGENAGALFHTAMGWGIGIAIHSAIYYVVIKPIKRFWDYTAFIHLITYIAVGVYLVLLNIFYSPAVLWSPIALGGWGIGIGFHILLAYLTKK